MRILLVNPAVYDFTLFDLWLKPLGLLYVEALLKEYGIETYFFDFLDRKSFRYSKEEILKLKDRKYGCGKYYSEPAQKPALYKNIKRRYKRFGLPLKYFNEFLKGIKEPDFIFITQIFSYGYEGAFEAARAIKEVFKNTKIVLSGPAVNLMPWFYEKSSSFDYVITSYSVKELVQKINGIVNLKIPVKTFFHMPLPDFTKYKNCSYSVLLTRLGCPFNCSYCAQKKLFPGMEKGDIKRIYDFIKEEYRRGIRNFAFYDDALLYLFNEHLKPFLDLILNDNDLKDINFHTPNGLHLKYLNLKAAQYLVRSGFKTIRLSLESADDDFLKRTGAKTSRAEYLNALKNLREAGFNKKIDTYILAGMRGQKISDIENTVKFVKDAGAKPKFSWYSPVPGSRDFNNVNKKELLKSPLFHNKTAYAILDDVLSENDKNRLRLIL